MGQHCPQRGRRRRRSSRTRGPGPPALRPNCSPQLPPWRTCTCTHFLLGPSRSVGRKNFVAAGTLRDRLGCQGKMDSPLLEEAGGWEAITLEQEFVWRVWHRGPWRCLLGLSSFYFSRSISVTPGRWGLG